MSNNPSFKSVVQRPILYGGSFAPDSAAEQEKAQDCPASCCTNSHFTKAYEENMIAEKRSSNRMTIEGKLVDMRCYSISLENHAQDHVVPPSKEKTKIGCATACCSVGIPAGLLVDGIVGGQVFVLLSPSTQLAPHMNKWVRVVGRLMKDSHALFAISVEVRNDEDGMFYNCLKTNTPM